MRRYYHGTNMIFSDIDLNLCRLRTDFGKGFYIGTNLGVSREWAKSQSMRHEVPTVIRFVLSKVIFDLNDKSLKRCWFSSPSVDWLNFVRDNRSLVAQDLPNKEPRHDYDIVYGPIANDKVVDVVDEYIDGTISADEAIQRVKVIKSVYQISLHTQKALMYIEQSLTEYQQIIKGAKWTEWKQL